MIVKIIFGQREEDYPGQYAPEALECISEYNYQESPTWLEDKLEQYRTDKSFVQISVVEIKVDQDKIHNYLTKPLRLDGKVAE